MLSNEQQLVRKEERMEYLFFMHKEDKVVRLSSRASQEHFGESCCPP